jgi:hypothetical protein
MSHLPTVTASTIIAQVVGCAQGQMSQWACGKLCGPRRRGIGNVPSSPGSRHACWYLWIVTTSFGDLVTVGKGCVGIRHGVRLTLNRSHFG